MKRLQVLFLLLLVFACDVACHPLKPSLKRRRSDSSKVGSVDSDSGSPGCDVSAISQDAELDALLRPFVIDPAADESAVSRMLASVLSMSDSPLSVEVYLQCKKEAELIRLNMDEAFVPDPALDSKTRNPVDRDYLQHKEILKSRSVEHARTVLRYFPHGSRVLAYNSAIVILVPVNDVVVKIPNPFYSFHQHERFLLGGVGGENKSPYRQVSRVLAASKINEICSAKGVRAPKKTLYLRPGAVLSGPIDDAHTVICCERMLKKDKIGDFDMACLPKDMIEVFKDVAAIIGAADFSNENIWVMRDPGGDGNVFFIIDTEKPSVEPLADYFEPFELFQSFEATLFSGSFSVAELQKKICFLLGAVPALVSKEKQQQLVWFSICRYLFLLTVRGELSKDKAAHIKGQIRSRLIAG